MGLVWPLTSIAGLVVQGEIAVEQLDLADLQSIHTFTENCLAHEKGPDLLILNAGVMACPESYTKDAFEMQSVRSVLMKTWQCCTIKHLIMHMFNAWQEGGAFEL